MAVLVGLVLGVCFGLPEKQVQPGFAQAQAQPNILVVGTDDNNYEILRKAMDNVNTRIGAQGATFENFTYSQSLCCPNRASTQRGQYPHNTDVLRNEPPHGGFEIFFNRKYYLDTLGRTIDDAHYNMAYVGKYMNGYPNRRDARGSYFSVVPTGWDRWIVGDPGGQDEDNPCLSIDGKRRCPSAYERGSFDGYMASKARPIVENWDETPGPDMMFLSFYNPHGPWQHPKSYDNDFAGAKPESPSYAELDVSDKPPFIRDNPRGKQVRQEWEHEYREKLRSAAYTDDLIGGVLDTLEDTGEASNTYVVFWNDNGYKTGQHRLNSKNSPYLEDERFPLLVRGPGIVSGTRRELVNSVDIRPTLEDMAGASEATPDYVDGSSFLPLAKGVSIPWRTYTYGESVWELSDGAAAQVRTEVRSLHKQGKHKQARAMLFVMSESALPAWRAVYTQTGAYHMWLSGGSTGYEEFYTLPSDWWELDGAIDATEEPQLQAYRERMAEFQSCAGETCRNAGFVVPEANNP